jgi:hypothetical protein
MSRGFTPGALDRRQADLLNALLDRLAAVERLSVAPPLSLTRRAGVPSISIRPLGETLLAKITGHDSSTPPIHTATAQGEVQGGTPADALPTGEYPTVYNALASTALEDNTLVSLVAIPGSPNGYWAFPLQVGFPAKLTSAWDAVTGYSWALLVRSGLTLAPASPAIAGTCAAPATRKT